MATNKTARAKRVQAKAATEKTRLEAMYTTEAMVITISEAKAAAEATAIPDSEEKATPEATAIPDSEAKATEAETKAIAEAQAAKAATETEATLMFQQEPGDPPDVLGLASKPPPQLATAPPPLSRETENTLTNTAVQAGMMGSNGCVGALEQTTAATRCSTNLNSQHIKRPHDSRRRYSIGRNLV